MPTVLTHAALPLIAGAAMGRARAPVPLVIAGMVAAALPDLDVISLSAGIPYDAPASHRGISHSLAFAVFVGLLAWCCGSWLKAKRMTAFLFVGLAAASHGLADMLTNKGRGVEYWWPLSDERYFAAFRPLDVASIGLRGVRAGTIWDALWSEFIWLILPAIVLALLYRFWWVPHIDSARGES